MDKNHATEGLTWRRRDNLEFVHNDMTFVSGCARVSKENKDFDDYPMIKGKEASLFMTAAGVWYALSIKGESITIELDPDLEVAKMKLRLLAD